MSMTTIWRKVRHNGDDCYAYCGKMDGTSYVEKCRDYSPDCLCKTCRYQTGKVIDEEREEE